MGKIQSLLLELFGFEFNYWDDDPEVVSLLGLRSLLEARHQVFIA